MPWTDTSPLEYLNVPNPLELLGKVTSSYSRMESANMTFPPKRYTLVYHCDFLHRHRGNPPLPPTSVFCRTGGSAEPRAVHRGLSAHHLIDDISPHNLVTSQRSDNQQVPFDQGQCEVPPGLLQPAHPHMLSGHTRFPRKAPQAQSAAQGPWRACPGTPLPQSGAQKEVLRAGPSSHRQTLVFHGFLLFLLFLFLLFV